MKFSIKSHFVIILLLVLSCSKNEYKRANKEFFKEYKNSTWELIKVTDANGTDITSAVLADSMHCKYIKLTDKVLKKNVYYEAIYTDCKKCLFESYLGFWGVQNSETSENSFFVELSSFYTDKSFFQYHIYSNTYISENQEFTGSVVLRNSSNIYRYQYLTYKKI